MSKRFANYHRNSRLEDVRQTGTCITIPPEVPHLEQQATPRAALPNCTNHFSA